MHKPPAFQFYPKDFLNDYNVVAMSMEEVGMYIKLLCYCWMENGIPVDDSHPIAKLLLNPKVAKCFYKKNERFFNPRLDEERKKQKRFAKSMKEAGLRGAKKRWGGHSQAIARGIASDSSSSSSSSSTSVLTPLPPLRKGGRKYQRKIAGSNSDPAYREAYENKKAKEGKP